MALDTIAKRLKWAREQTGKWATATEAAQAHGWTVSTYLGHENGDRNPSREKAKQYAKAYRTRWEWILEGQGLPFAKDPGIPVDGYVGAGTEVRPFDDSNMGLGYAPFSVEPNSAAVIVRGDSMYPRYFDGEYIYYIREPHQPNDFHGRECVVRLADGRMFVKILRRGTKKGLFHLESWNAATMEDQQVEWAAPVTWRRG